MRHLDRLWSAKLWILLAVIAGAAAGGLVDVSLPHDYRATAMVRVIDPQMMQEVEEFNVGEVIPLFRTSRVAMQVMDETGIGASPWNIDLIEFRERLRVAEIPGTRFITVSVDLPDAELAQTVANRLAESAVQLHGELLSHQIEHNRELLLPQLASASRRMQPPNGEAPVVVPDPPRDGDSLASLAGPLTAFVELYRRGVAPSDDERRQTAAGVAYSELLKAYESVEFNVIARNPRLEVIDPASSASPLPRTVSGFIVFGGLFGLIVSVFLVVAWGTIAAGKAGRAGAP